MLVKIAKFDPTKINFGADEQKQAYAAALTLRVRQYPLKTGDKLTKLDYGAVNLNYKLDV